MQIKQFEREEVVGKCNCCGKVICKEDEVIITEDQKSIHQADCFQSYLKDKEVDRGEVIASKTKGEHLFDLEWIKQNNNLYN